MIATITLNPSLDEHIFVPKLVLAETNRWTKLRRNAGGKGIDVSRAVHAMGGETMAYGFIGGDQGRALEILLDNEGGVPFGFTPIQQETRTNFIITDAETLQQTRILAPGPRISKRELERFLRKLSQMRPKPDLFVASGSVPPGVPENIYYQIISEARSQNVRTILDTTRQWLHEGLKAKPFLVKPNVQEAEALFKIWLDTEEAIINTALHLVEMGVEIGVISRGKDGLIAATKEKIIKAVPPRVKVKSTVGAGDSTVAGFALKLANNEPLIEACRLATAMGTAAVMNPGTGLSHRADVENILPKIKIIEIPVRERAKTYSIA